MPKKSGVFDNSKSFITLLLYVEINTADIKF